MNLFNATCLAIQMIENPMEPLIAGMVYDADGYAPFLIAGTIGYTLYGFMLITLPRYPDCVQAEWRVRHWWADRRWPDRCGL